MFAKKLLSGFDVVVAIIIIAPLSGFFDVLLTVLGAGYFLYKFISYPKIFHPLDAVVGVYVLLTLWFFPLGLHVLVGLFLVIRGFVRAIF